MPDRLYFTDSDEANELIASDPMALLVGFALDQQVTVQQAFLGPLRIRERLGSLEPARLARTDLEPVFKQKPAIHRFPAKMAQRVQALAAHVRDEYGGEARGGPRATVENRICDSHVLDVVQLPHGKLQPSPVRIAGSDKIRVYSQAPKDSVRRVDFSSRAKAVHVHAHRSYASPIDR